MPFLMSFADSSQVASLLHFSCWLNAYLEEVCSASVGTSSYKSKLNPEEPE